MKELILICSWVLAVWLLCANPAVATTPTVTIMGYNMTPAVLLPEDSGMLRFICIITDQNVREQESSGGPGTGFENSQTAATDVFIRNIHVESDGITVLILSPTLSGMYFPERLQYGG